MKQLRVFLLYVDAIFARIKRQFRKRSETFFTSDLHFGHRNVINYCNRPFSSVEQMDRFLLFQWNCYIDINDNVFCLGDLGINGKTPQRIGNKLNGNKTLVPGNHDSQFAFAKRKNNHLAKAIQEAEKAGWIVAQHYKKNIYGVETFMCHLPPKKGAQTFHDARYMEERVENDPALIYLNGHLHGRHIKQDNMIDVGWDAHLRPITAKKIKEVIDDKRTFIPSRLTKFYEQRKENEY